MKYSYCNLFMLCYTVSAALRLVNGQSIIPPDEICFQCICEMATRCNLTFGCNDQHQCGPFRMTEPFWEDAGKIILELDHLNIPGAFARCANDPFCARMTTESYFKKFGKDCNSDGITNCEDYGIIHHYGYDFCEGKQLPSEQATDLIKCLRKSKIP